MCLMRKLILFISMDGMTDPLGQSQVLPYLTGLASKGFSISIVSCEKPANFNVNQEAVKYIAEKNGIHWAYCFYRNKIPLLSQIQNFLQLKKLASKTAHNFNCTLVHCRSYPSGLIGMKLKEKKGLKFIFDMRGFWADERIEGKIWNLKNPMHKILIPLF